MACILTSIIKCWLEKIRVCTSRNSTYKTGRMQVTCIRKTVFHYRTCNKPKHPFYFILFKDSIFSCEKTHTFAWNLHLEMTYLSLRLLSFCFHIPFSLQSPSLVPLASATDKLWWMSKDISPLKVFFSYTWPQERGAFVGKKTSAMIMSLIICYFYSHTFYKQEAKIKEIDFTLIFSTFPGGVVLKRNRKY